MRAFLVLGILVCLFAIIKAKDHQQNDKSSADVEKDNKNYDDLFRDGNQKKDKPADDDLPSQNDDVNDDEDDGTEDQELRKAYEDDSDEDSNENEENGDVNEDEQTPMNDDGTTWSEPGPGYAEDETMDLYSDYDTDEQFDDEEYTNDELGHTEGEEEEDNDDENDEMKDDDKNDVDEKKNVDEKRNIEDEKDTINVNGKNDKDVADDGQKDAFDTLNDDINKNALVLHEDSRTSPALFDDEDNDEDEEDDEENDEDLLNDEEESDEEFDERALEQESNDARPWGRRRRSKRRRWIRPRIRIPPIRIPKIRVPIFRGRIIRRPLRLVRKIRLPRRLRRIRFRRIGKIIKKIGGHVKRINFRKIGHFFGKIAQKLSNFLKCAFPKLFRRGVCAKQIFKSIKSCVKRNQECRLEIGGRNSHCLSYRRFKSFSMSYGPITATGHTSSAIGLSIKAYFNRKKTYISLYGHVAANAKIRFKLNRYSKHLHHRRITLGPRVFLFQKMVVVLIGGIPMPIRITLHAQPVAVLHLNARTYGSVDASITLNRDARISLDHARIEFSNGRPKFSKRFSSSLRHLRLVKHANVNGIFQLINSYFQVGVEISVTITGRGTDIIYPYVEFGLNGGVQGHWRYPPGNGCIQGSFKTLLRARVKLQPNPQHYNSVSQNFNRGCNKMGRVLCKRVNKNIFVKVAKCSKIVPNFSCQKTVGKGCNGFSNALKGLPNPNPRKKNAKPRYYELATIARGTWRFGLGNCYRRPG